MQSKGTTWQKRGSGKQTVRRTVHGSVVHPRTASPSVWRTAREVIGEGQAGMDCGGSIGNASKFGFYCLGN